MRKRRTPAQLVQEGWHYTSYHLPLTAYEIWSKADQVMLYDRRAQKVVNVQKVAE